MATKKQSAAEPLARPDEQTQFGQAILALTEASKARTFGEMAHVEGVLAHTLVMLGAIRQRHLHAVNDELAATLRLRVQWLTDYLHRAIVWDERHLERVPDGERAGVEADIEQRREFIRQAQRLLEAVQ